MTVKSFATGAFNAVASIIGGAGTLAGGVWTLAEATGFPNGIVHQSDLLKAAFFTAASATLFTLGHKRVFFTGKTSEFLKKKFGPNL